jgi:(p)ppGpp synthase/HD superfamily hydrolase
MIISKPHSYEFDKLIEKAIIYLVQSFVGTGRNPKPVILHSIRMGVYLYKNNYHQNVVVAAILHDLLEDTDTKVEDIEKEFGKEVGNLVSANTFNVSIINKFERDIEMLNRCKDAGKWSLLIKAIDILDNSDYFILSKEEEQSHRLLRKMKLFLEMSTGELGKEPVWSLLRHRYEELRISSGINP